MSSVLNNESPALQGKRVAFVGKLGGVNRREAQQLVRDQGGVSVAKCSAEVDLIVIGADELPLAEDGELLDAEIRDAAGDGRLEIISETQFWQRLGIVEAEQHVRRLYTPAMLADLLGVTVSIVRRWHRRGLIVPAREVQRLPYFDFQEIATAQRLAQLLAAGASPAAIEAKLAALSRYVPDVDRPIAQLSVIVEGKQLLLRQGEGLVEPGGQLRIDFDALEAYAEEMSDESEGSSDQVTLLLASHLAEASEPTTPEEMVEAAITYEDDGHLESAVEMYRAALTAGGARPEVCFHLAELLYLLGDISAARERYFMAIELDENFVEARANLGCVLAETGELELAVAAFQGTLAHHRDYPDVHYHLARTLDELERPEEADIHWLEFLKLAPDSPWADEARDRLQ
ncbi:MAG: MerR family transcriptional regulator [Planctomycetes bacterium]|nr:MerR family transcriptional regulator [Planctomycetota bacterium]